VNWSATARFGELMVRQDDQQNDQHAVVVLDSARSSYGFGSDTAGAAPFSPEFEWAVSMAASIGLHLLGEGFHVRVVDSADGLANARGRFHTDGTRFEPNSGDDDLLLHAAKSKLIEAYEVDFHSALSRSESSAGDLPPMFAVVGNLSPASAQSLAGSARFASGAVAVIVIAPPAAHHGPAQKISAHGRAAHNSADPPRWALDLREQLEAGGWIAQFVTSDEAPSVVWGSVDGERLVL
jgi:hypothetical protein